MKDEHIGTYDDGESDADGDDQVDWSQIEEVDRQVNAINDIEDDEERLTVAREWAERLNNG